jgi:hypothetical protein
MPTTWPLVRVLTGHGTGTPDSPANMLQVVVLAATSEVLLSPGRSACVRGRLFLVAALMLVATGGGAATAMASDPPPVNMTGHWASPLDMTGIDFAQTGSSVSGDSISGLHVRGTLVERRVTFIFWRGEAFADADPENRGVGTIDVGLDGNIARVHWASEDPTGTYNGTFDIVRVGPAGPQSTSASDAEASSTTLAGDINHWDELLGAMFASDQWPDIVDIEGALAWLQEQGEVAALWADAQVAAALCLVQSLAGPADPEGSITAAGAGTVTWIGIILGRAAVRVEGEGGTFLYYNMMPDLLVGIGDTVQVGQPLGEGAGPGFAERVADAAGKVVDITQDDDGDMMVAVLEEDGSVSWYHQFGTVFVSIGQTVQAGEPLGTFSQSYLQGWVLTPQEDGSTGGVEPSDAAVEAAWEAASGSTDVPTTLESFLDAAVEIAEP